MYYGIRISLCNLEDIPKNRYLGDVRAYHSGRAVLGTNCVRPLEHWGRGVESYSRHGYLYAFILCLCCSVCW
jgi:hypothetical protein